MYCKWRYLAVGVCVSTLFALRCGCLLHHAVRVCACVLRTHFTLACCVAAACMLVCSCDDCSVSWSTGACWGAHSCVTSVLSLMRPPVCTGVSPCLVRAPCDAACWYGHDRLRLCVCMCAPSLRKSSQLHAGSSLVLLHGLYLAFCCRVLGQ